MLKEHQFLFPRFSSIPEKYLARRLMNQIHVNNITLEAISSCGTGQVFCDGGEGVQILPRISLHNFLLMLACTFYAPSALVWLEIIPFHYRFYALFCVLSGFACFCFRRRYSLQELGIRTDNLKGSLQWNLLFCLAGAIGLYAAFIAGIVRPRDTGYLPSAYIFYIVFLGPIQEIIFRGVLFAEMKRMRSIDDKWIILTATLSFCFLHIIYNHPPLLLIALISGLAWGIIFTKYPNILGVSLSHSFLGALAMFLGVI